MTRLSFVTAIGPYHAHLIETISAEVNNQTVECDHVVVNDTDGHGAGWARNHGLAKVRTPLVAFLDADDQIAPTWADETIRAFDARGGNRYVYTDHTQDGRIVEAPEVAWINHTWHVITALIPTAWVLAVGGFDETLPAFEDTDFYLRLQTAGYCGSRLARPLFEYGAGGQRSTTHYGTPVHDAAMRYFSVNYGGRTVGCCGDVTPNIPPSGERQAGDVLAVAIYSGNRRELGRATGRLYPRVGNGSRLWMNAQDIAASPALWRAVSAQEADTSTPSFDYSDFADYQRTQGEPIAPTPLSGVEEIAAFFMQSSEAVAVSEPAAQAIDIEAAPSGAKPDIVTIREKARRGRRKARSA